jgi:hypothetical protein
MAFLPGYAKADASKLGSEEDPIRQMLFASQSLKEQVRRAHLDGSRSPFQTIADAAKLIESGKKEDAITRLRGVLDLPQLETRVQLWVWSALRELGERPDPKFAFEVLGVIIEMPSGDGCDTLAAYVDGSARYLNFSGNAIFWDAPDATIKGLCQAFVDSAIPASGQAKPRTSLSLPKSDGQVTLLTRSGLYVITAPPAAVVGAGAALMMELIKRTKEDPANKRREGTPGKSSPSNPSQVPGAPHP